MKIIVPVIQHLYGTIEIEVPENSPVSDPGASPIKRQRAAQKLGEEAYRADPGCVKWDDCPDPPGIECWYHTVSEN